MLENQRQEEEVEVEEGAEEEEQLEGWRSEQEVGAGIDMGRLGRSYVRRDLRKKKGEGEQQTHIYLINY